MMNYKKERRSFNMKKKFIFSSIMIVAMLLGVQAVFAQDYNLEFAEKFAANDMAGIETLLKGHGHQMDLQVCLNSVSHSLTWITLGSDPFDYRGGSLPLNRNRNSIFRAIQLLVDVGVDVNPYHHGLYFNREYGIQYNRGGDEFSNILYQAIRNSQPNMAIIRFLLESGAIPNFSELYGYDKQLFMAIDQGNAQLVKLLVDAGCKVDDTLSFYEGGANSSFRRDITSRQASTLSALQFAAYWGEYAIVKTLVEAGAKINFVMVTSTGYLGSKTAAIIARERGETDIYNYLMSSQVASAPPPSTPQSSSSYNDTYNYTPPPSSSSSSSSASSSSSSRSSAADVGRAIAEAFTPPLDSGTYGLSGTQAKIRLTGIAKSGMLTYTNKQGKTVSGYYNIDGNRMTVQADGYTYIYNITSKTSFSGHGETWVRTGY
jgi:hypothetical protein